MMIQVDNLSKCYRIYGQPIDRLKQSLFKRTGKQFYKEFWPVRNVSFSVERGEVIGLVGANGSGKSTVLQLVCGILQPTEGNVTLSGRVAALLELGSGFNPEFSGHDNLIMNAALLGLSTEQINARYDDILAFAGIGDFIHQPVKTYSSGMIVRLAFAISSFVDADILVVDEALAVGDAGFQAKCLERMEKLMQQGTTILLVTHDMQMVKRYCSRVIYMKKGQIAYDGDPEEATEIYLAETKESASIQQTIVKVDASQGDGRLKVSNGKGMISDVVLHCNGQSGTRIAVKQHERVEVRISASVDASVQYPRLQMTVRDARGYNLYGFNNYYAGRTLIPDANGMVFATFSFLANLQMAEYALTIRLDDTPSKEESNLLDKQVGICTFIVTAPEKTFEAVVDLAGDCEVNA
jgi:lipopolysaccharide transport system ATP-binding protein